MASSKIQSLWPVSPDIPPPPLPPLSILLEPDPADTKGRRPDSRAPSHEPSPQKPGFLLARSIPLNLEQ